MKIATYNINGINGRLPVLLRWLAQAQPDVVCLQELKCESHHFPEAAIKEAGYHAIWKGEKSWNGVAILSKDVIRQLRNDLPGADESYTHSRYIEGFTFGIVFGCLYLPNGNPYPGPKFEYKLRWFSRLIAHGRMLLDFGLPVMLVGDYNVMPTELDTYKPEKYKNNALFRVESRDAYVKLIDQGWTDAIRELYPGERIYTFWDYLRKAYERDAGLRLDHFLLNAILAERLRSGGVDKEVRGWEKSSDHAPVWIELSDAGEGHLVNSSGASEDGGTLPQRENNADGKHLTKPKSSPGNKGTVADDAMHAEVQALLDAAPAAEIPRTIKAMKATQVDQPFHDAGWVYEIKWDGYRSLAFVENGKAELVSRNDIVYAHFSPINELLASWDLPIVLDGEIVVLDEIGVPVFGALQNWREKKELNLVFYVFDILWYKGKLLTELTLLDRRKILEAVLPTGDGTVRISHLFEADGVAFYESAKRMKLEGIIAKRAESVYSSDARSREWLKVKAKLRQEVVIAGYTRNEDSGKTFSALAAGVYDEAGVLRYIGKVGTGFNDATQKELMKRFKSLESKVCPFEVIPDVDEPSRFRPQRLGAKPTWLKPELVCEVEFAEISRDGKLRQASFKGLREDKDPADVVLEIASSTAEVAANSAEEDAGSFPDQPDQPGDADGRRVKGIKRKMSDKPLLEGKNAVAELKIDGHLIKFNNLNKLYWPEDGISKRELFNYYDKIAPYMVPYLLDRPMSLNRFPGGIHGQSFYQKNVAETAPSWARTMPHTNEKGEDKAYLLGNDRATLLWMATLGCIEMNPWFSRVQSPDNPDYCVIDLDPDKNTFEQVIEAAQMTRTVLDGMGVPSFVKTSGSTGIHIYVPLGAKYSYDQSQLFAQVVVKLVNRELPTYTTLERMIANRSGKMYLDFMQNRPGATIAGVYSLRPKPGATVSMPLHWDEVKPGLTMRDFTIHNAPDRLRETGDLLTGVLGEGIDMMAAIGKARENFG
jgi:bifunctional non-homologous end joining protein LigD